MKGRLLRRLAWAALGLLTVMLLAWAVVPHVARSQIEQRGSDALGRAVSVGEVSFSPWALSLTLHGLSIAAAPADADRSPQLSIGRLHIDASLRTLLERAPVLEALEVDAPRLRLARLAAGRYDVDDVLARLQSARQPRPPAGGDEPARFAVFNVQVQAGELRFDDRPVERLHEVLGITLALPFVSNLPADLSVTVQPRLAATVGGSALDLRGRALPFSADRESELQLKFSALPLADWWAYLPAGLPLRPAGGVLDTDLSLRFAQPVGSPPRLGLSGRVTLADLSVANATGAPLVGWQRLSVGLGDVRPLERVVELSSIELAGLQADLRRDAAGRLEWQAMFDRPAAQGAVPAVPASAAASTAAPAHAAPWRFGLASLAVDDATLRWHDAGTEPAAAFELRPLQLRLQSLAWPDAAAVPLTLSAPLHAGAGAGRPVGRLAVQGTLSVQAAQPGAALTLTLGDVDLSAAAPYLQAVLAPRLEGRLDATATLDWAGGAAPRRVLALPALRLSGLAVNDGQRTGPPALRVASVELDDVRVDLLARQAGAAALRVKDPAVRLARAEPGPWNVQAWILPSKTAAATPETPQAAPPQPPAAPWRAELTSFALSGGRLQVDDRGTGGRPVSITLNAVQLGARGLGWPAGRQPVAFDVAAVWPDAGPARAAPARLAARGRASLAPFEWRGRLDAQRLPVHALEPYFAARVPVLVRRAELGYQGEVDLRLGADGVALDLQGDVLLADLRVQSRAGEAAGGTAADEGGDELLAWQSLTLRPLSVRLRPDARPAVEIGELVLSDFFSRLIITEQGRFNLRDVRAEPAAATPPAAAAAAAAPPAAAASATTAAGPAPGPGVDLVIGSTRLVAGRVDFTDRFIRPSYSAQLTELNGSVGRFASGSREMATLELRGRAAGTALLEIRGALNPTADPLALDISARATDLELAPLSPYAGKYAGYAIERGKLSLDIAYRVDPDGKLSARNQLVLNQLTFGERIEGPDVTKLPVRLAVALLTDRNGVIDINLPISGSINDPEFSVFGLVLRVIGNLIVKAVTAPFSLLAGGGGEDVSHIDFVPGTTAIAEAGKPVIERIGKALADRPALRLTIAGTADPAAERDAIQAAALETRLQTEQRRELARAGKAAAADAVLPPLDGAERLRLVQQIYSETRLPNKPRNLIGLAKTLPLEEMEALLEQATVVNDDSARELAIQRGLAVRDALIATGLPAERLFLGAPKLPGGDSETDTAAWTPRAQLSLSAP